MNRKHQEMDEKVCDEGLLYRVEKACKFGSESDPQWHLNTMNIWIIKPASMSRGRGIKTFNNL